MNPIKSKEILTLICYENVQVLLVNFRKEIASFLPEKVLIGSASEADQCSDVLLCIDHLAVIAHNEDAHGSVRDHV